MIDRYLAGQTTCRECGNIELLIRRENMPWRRVRRCKQCDSRWADVPVWWPVDDKKAIAAAMSADFNRAAVAFVRRKGMN